MNPGEKTDNPKTDWLSGLYDDPTKRSLIRITVVCCGLAIAKFLRGYKFPGK